MLQYLTSVLLSLGPWALFPQEDRLRQDSLIITEHAGAKSGFAWGGTPVLAYDSDMGLRYGAVINLFDYGKESRYPDYLQYARIRLYNSTKGTSNYSLLYDSEKLLSRSHLTFETSYIEDIALDFYGFNGSNSVYIPEFTDPDHPGYINKYFYTHHRKLFRTRLDLQMHLTSKELRLYTGITYSHYRMNDLEYSKFDIPTGNDGSNFSNSTLYSKYVEWGLISPEEKNGGQLVTFTGGVIYDTRHSKINCKGGVWFESYFVLSPPSLSSSFFVKQITTFRQYMPWTRLNALFTYRISSQQKLAGNIPFYALPTFYTSLENQDGLGGAHTLRGIYRNRIVADGYLAGNAEIRKNVVHFRLLNIDWETDISLFSDMAWITGQYRITTLGIPDEYLSDLFRDEKQKIHATLGAGLYLIYNTNNVVSVNYGFSFDPQMGGKGLYIGAGFMF